MADFRMDLQFRDGTNIGTIPFADLQGEFRMNQPNEIRFKTSSADLPNYVNPVSQLKAGLTECVLYRNGAKIFTGPIWTIDTTSDEKILTIMAQDVSSYLKQRIVAADTRFTKKRFAYALWKLISDAQALSNGSLGITLGQDAVTNPTGTFSFTRKSNTTLAKAASKLCDGSTGFDWLINPDRQLMMYYPRIQTQSNVRLEYGGGIKSYSVRDVGTVVANEVFAVGGNKYVSSTYTDADSIAKFGRRQYVVQDSSLKSKSKADSVAKTQLSLRKNPRLIPQVTINTEIVNPFVDDLSYGNLIYVNIDDGWVQFDGLMRSSGFQLSIGKHGDETFVLYINDTREIEDTGI